MILITFHYLSASSTALMALVRAARPCGWDWDLLAAARNDLPLAGSDCDCTRRIPLGQELGLLNYVSRRPMFSGVGPFLLPLEI
jgi:hypothetical protein